MSHSNSRLDKLSFVHIPKTAGISLHAELLNYFGRDKSIRFGDKQRRVLFSSMDPDQFKKYNYITGHLTVAELLGKEISYPTISVVREPVKRLYSLQHYLTNSKFKNHQDFNFSSIDQLLKYMYNTNSCNVQCWHLAAKKGNKFDLAVESIESNKIFVVPLEYFQDLIETLSDLLETPLNILHKNVTKYNNSVGSEVLKHELLDSLIGEDRKLFSYVKQNYGNIKQEFIKSLIR